MSLRYIIDAYNVIKSPDFPPGKAKTCSPVSLLVDLLRTKNLCGSRKNTAFLVFDGYPPGGREQGVLPECQFRVIFSRQESADERIKKMIEAETDRKNLILVSNDKELCLFARLFKVKALSAGEFLKTEIQSSRLEKLRIIAEEAKDITYSQTRKINEELKNIWLRR